MARLSILAEGYVALLLIAYLAMALVMADMTAQWTTPEVLAAYVLILSALAWTAVRPPRAGILVGGTVLAGLAIASFGGSLTALIVACGLGLLAYGVGARVLDGMWSADALSVLERGPVAIALGAGVLSYSILALSLAGLLTAPAVATALLVLAVATCRRVFRDIRELSRWVSTCRPAARATPFTALACAWSLILFVEAIAPEIQYDALSYHLGLPRVWLAAGRLIDVPEQVQSYFYLGFDMNYTAAMLFGGQTAARLLNLGFLALTASAVYGFVRSTVAPSAAATAALLFVATPIVAWCATTAFVDQIVAGYVFLALAVGYRAIERGPRAGAVAGVLAGLAVATKITAILAVVPVGVVVAAAAIARGRRLGLTTSLAFAAGATLACVPWPFLRFVQTGNPVFPLLNGVFRSPLWPAVNETFDLAGFGIGRDPAALLTLPLAVTFQAGLFVEAMKGSVMGLGLLLVPLAFGLARRSRALAYMTSGAVLTFVVWGLSVQYGRYLVPFAGPIAVTAAAVLDELAAKQGASGRGAARWFGTAIVALSIPLFIATFWNIPERIPIRVAAGFEERATYLTRILPTYAAFDSIAREPDGAASYVVLVSRAGGRGDDEDRLYAPGRVETIISQRAAELFMTSDESVALAWLREHHVTHVLVNRDGLHGGLAQAAISRADFLRRIGTLAYSNGPMELYRLR